MYLALSLWPVLLGHASSLPWYAEEVKQDNHKVMGGSHQELGNCSYFSKVGGTLRPGCRSQVSLSP